MRYRLLLCLPPTVLLAVLLCLPAAFAAPAPAPAVTQTEALDLDADAGADEPDAGAADAVDDIPAVARDPTLAERLAAIGGLEGVRVRRYGGVVFLEGEVLAEADRELAVTIARGGEGVRDVVNNIEISTRLRDRVNDAARESVRRLERFIGSAPLFAVAVLVVWLAWWSSARLADARWLARPFGGNEFAAQVLRHAVRIGGIVVGLVLALRLLDAVALAGALVGSAGVLGIVIGFAFRDLVENYVSSILLSLRQPFRPNDHVVIAGKEGIVVGLTSRVTVLMTPDGNHLTLPNALVFKSDMLNYSRNPHRRFEFNLVLAPETSTTLVLEEGLAELRNIDGVLSDPPPTVMVVRAARDAVEFQCMGWVDHRACNIGWVRSEAIRKLRSRLRMAGVQFGAAAPAAAAPRPAQPEPEPREPLLGRRAPPEAEALRPAVEATRRELGGQDLMREPGARTVF